MYATGLLPDRHSTRLNDQNIYYGGTYGSAAAMVHVPSWIRDQRNFSSCVGQAFASCIDYVTGKPPWASAVSIWREARRRQGKIERIDQGTRLEYAVEGLVHRGWDPFKAGEDFDTLEASQQDDLFDELFAHDKRMLGVKRYRIGSYHKLDSIEAALAAGMGVVFGSGTKAPLYSYVGDAGTKDLVLGTAHWGGLANGHAVRIVTAGFGRTYLIQNSWGQAWGGAHGLDGTWYPGCAWISGNVLIEAWDIHAIEIKA